MNIYMCYAKPEGWTADGEILGILLYFLAMIALWAIGTLWSYHNAEKARRMVKKVEDRKARARLNVMEREQAGNYGTRRRDVARNPRARRVMR